jgi:zinc transporter, ZIP family
MAVVMALGAGVLVSSVAFELMDEAYKVGGLDAAAPGLLLGAAVFYLADREVTRRGGERRKNSGNAQGGLATAIAIGALLDGIPESAAIGISLIEGGGVGIALVAAVFLSNVPEGLSSAARHEARRTLPGLRAGPVGRRHAGLDPLSTSRLPLP